MTWVFPYFAFAMKGLQRMLAVQETMLCERRHTDPISCPGSLSCKKRDFVYVRSFLSVLVSLPPKIRADQIFICGHCGLSLWHTSLPFKSHKTVDSTTNEFSPDSLVSTLSLKWLKDLLEITGLVWTQAWFLQYSTLLPTWKGNSKEWRLWMWKFLAHFVIWKHHTTTSSAIPGHIGGRLRIENYGLARDWHATVF